MSGHDFQEVIRNDGPKIVSEYKDFKWRGYTGCRKVTLMFMEALKARGLAQMACFHGISCHSFALTRVAQQLVWVDFSFDQFLDYKGVREHTQRAWNESVPCEGVLVMPVHSMSFKDLNYPPLLGRKVGI